MNPPQADFGGLTARLAEELRELQGFAALLREEQALLTQTSNADALLPLMERKTAAAARLAALAEKRETELRQLGYEVGAGIRAWLEDASGEVKARWEEFIKLAQQARDQNETNGVLIGMHWQHNQAALAVLMSAANQAMTYGPDGQQTTSSSGRTLGSA